MKIMWKKGEEEFARYAKRNAKREKKIIISTVNLVSYFMTLGDTSEEANLKVSSLSNEVKSNISIFILGNTQPLIDAIQNSTLEHMTTEAKDFIISQLTE